jgi:DNA polymerase/3'-5' exonuclease PolX
VKYIEGYELATSLMHELSPFCKRISIAGSIRRRKAEVGDIELVAIPTWKLEDWRLRCHHRFEKKGNKYWQFYYCNETVDLFLCTEGTWAMNYLIRTGSAEWIHQFMIDIQKVGYCSIDSRLCRIGKDCDVPEPVTGIKEELDIFKLLNMPWVSPENRK